MKYIKLLLSFLILFSFKYGKSATKALGPVTIADLVNNSEVIYIAKFIKAENKLFYFAVKEIDSKNNFYDTIKIKDNSQDFDTIQNRLYRPKLQLQKINNKISKISWAISEGDEELIKIQDADELILFIYKDYDIPFYFLTKNKKIYREGYNDLISKYNFYNIAKGRTWEKQISIIKNVKKRIDEINNIHSIKDDKIRNRKLFQWIEKNRNSLTQKCTWENENDDCGWSTINRDVFRWITEAGISKDTWKSAKLFREILISDENDDSFLYDYGKNSFVSESSIKFLIKIVLNPENSISERVQALIFLKGSDKEFSSTIKLKNKELFNKLIELNNTELPSRIKNELCFFLYSVTNKKEWFVITGNKNREFVQLSVCYKDGDLENLCIDAFNYGDGIINNKSVYLILEKFDNNKISISETKMIPISNFEITFTSQQIELKLDELSPGNWKIYIQGGTNNEKVEWKSQSLNIKI